MQRSALTWCVLLFACNAELVNSQDHDDDPDIGSTTASIIKDVTCGPPPDGTVISMNSINAALATEGSLVRFSAGICVVDQRFRVRANNITIEGAGPNVTIIRATPPSTQTELFHIDNLGVMQNNEYVPIQNTTLRDLAIDTLDNPSAAITAVYVHDARNFTMERVNIGPWAVADTGLKTTGIEIVGRDLGLVRKVRVEAGLPLRIGVNYHDAGAGTYRDDLKDLDQHHFEDLTLTSIVQGQPVIVVQAGAVLRNITFDGYQSWNRGGLVWADSDSTPARRHSNHLRFANVRVDNLCSGSGSCGLYAIDITKNTNSPPMTDEGPAQLDDLLVENSLTAARLLNGSAPVWNGIRTARTTGAPQPPVERTVLRQVVYEGSGTGVSVDGPLTTIP
ncbi:MAG TPA: hypothetical protein VFU21_24890 [Kofleriaceae bacterium]|nr:hypothetical protein [Kofleriaceae bacterium]